MVFSAKLALFAFLQDMRSISLGRNLKAFILRCVLFWPRLLRSLMKVWSWYFQTSARDEKETKMDTGGPSFVGAMGKREECVVVCASQDFGGVGGRPNFDISTPPTMTHDSQDSASEVSIQVEQPFSLTQTSLTSQVSIHVEQPTRPASPAITSHQHPSTESVNSLTVSLDLREHSPSMSGGQIGAQDSKERIQDPLTSQPTQTPQFTFPEPSTSRKLTTNDIIRRTSSMPHSLSSSHVPSPQGSSKLSALPLLLGGPYTLASSLQAESPQLSPVHGRTPSLSTHHQFSSTESMNPSEVSLHPREHGPSMHWVNPGAHQSRVSSHGSVTSQSSRASNWPPFMDPDPSTSGTSRMSAQISTTNAPNSSSRPGTPLVRPMHSDQVSRYVKKGDV